MEFLRQHVGEAAALGAATCWVFTSLAFSAASRRIGPTVVNVIRILLAWSILLVIHRLLVGRWLPQTDRSTVELLALSGLIGFAIGDQLLFSAFVDIGPRLTTLLMTLTPPVAAALAWPLLHEPLGGWAMLGIAITLVGIAWVAQERPDPAAFRRHDHRHRARGLWCGSIAAICQAAGLILSKLGIGHTRMPQAEYLDPWSASLIRVSFGALAICALAIIRRAGRSASAVGAVATTVTPAAANRAAEGFQADSAKPRSGSVVPMALLLLTIGAILGPVVGVWFSLVAIDRAQAGIAATLMAMTPVFILPFAVWIEKERLSWRAMAGAAVAVAGVAILTWRS